MWVKLSDLCQGGFGIVDMPEFVRIALLKAGMMIKRETKEQPPSFEDYLKKLSNKTYEGQRFYPPKTCKLISKYNRWYRPFFGARVIVDDIEIDTDYCTLNRLQNLPVRIIPCIIPDAPAEWDTIGKFTTLTFFQFIYHEKTAMLHNPKTIWECTLEKLNADPAMFALFVQLLGIQAELAFENKPPHVWKNIYERMGLKPGELEKRIDNFPKVIKYCLEQTEALLA